MLTILPSEGHKYEPYPLDKFAEPDEEELHLDLNSFVLKKLVHAIRLSAGFSIRLVSSPMIVWV